MIKKIIIIFLIIVLYASAEKRIIIFETLYSNNYTLYAVNDLVKKNIFLYSDFDIVPNNNIKADNYKSIKSKIKELTLINNADVSVTYDILRYKKEFILNYVIFDKSKSSMWLEKRLYSKEDKLFESINQMLKDIYDYTSVHNDKVYIKEDEYISLIGYYSQKIYEAEDSKNIYDVFFNFYKDNIYFNIDYLEYLISRSDRTAVENIKIMTDSMNKKLDKNNHYYLSALGDYYYSKYKVNVIPDDIELSIENYIKAIEAKKNNYIYYKKLANAYILKNDYDNAAKSYNMAIEIYDKDVSLIKDAVYLLKRDMNKNGNIVIEYLKKIIDVNKNDDEALENLAQIYDTLGDKYNSEIYYNKLLDAINYNLYIINNESPNPVLYDKYMKKRNEVSKKLNSFK